jgi:hypothetical protein
LQGSSAKMADMDEMYPAGPEDSLQLIEEMPVYRHIGSQVFDPLPSVFNDTIFLPDESELMVDIPVYHKGINGLPTKGARDVGFAELMSQSEAISLMIPSPSSSKRAASPFASKLPAYGADDLLPLETTHFRVASCRGGSVSPCAELVEETLVAAITSYLKDHAEQIVVSSELDLLHGPSVGHWKCSTGTLNNNFSYENNYSAFAIQCYVDSIANDGTMIVEWQRRRGNVHMFQLMFEHFSTAVSAYMADACKRSGPATVSSITPAVESMTVVPSSLPGRLDTAVATVSKLFIDPVASVDLSSEYTPNTIRKTLSAGGSVVLSAAEDMLAVAGVPKLQRDKGHNNISPTGPADMISMFND